MKPRPLAVRPEELRAIRRAFCRGLPSVLGEMAPRAWDRSPRAGDRSGCRFARPFFCPPRPQRGPPDVDGPLGGAILIPRPLGVVGYCQGVARLFKSNGIRISRSLLSLRS